MSNPSGKSRTQAPRSHLTWGGRFAQGPSELMQCFGESVSFDARLAPYDVAGSKAHARMLAHVGLLTGKDRDAICKGLDALLDEIAAGKFSWDPALEDVHMNIEQALTRRVPAAARLHTARSRNDQIATDMRLFFKDACARLDERLRGLLTVLADLAADHVDLYLPGYTHLQRAQPVSAAHHLLAYAEMFSRDRERLAQVADRANWCPLGSGALAGTTLPIDRAFSARELGFVDTRGRPRLTRNSMDAVADRDLFIDFASACCVCGTHFSRIAEDLILWNSAEFRFITLPDTFTTGSSLMPQKKNPDSLEILRGKSGRLHGSLVALVTMVKGLPLTYNRDLQEDKPPVFDAFDTTALCLEVLAETLRGVAFDEAACMAAVQDPLLLATDLADLFVERGIPFREAHHLVGRLVAKAEHFGVPLDSLSDAHAQALDERIEPGWQKVFDLERAMKSRNRTGMPGPREVEKQIARLRRELAPPGRPAQKAPTQGKARPAAKRKR